VETLTDHNNLVGFAKVKQLSGRQTRWAILLSAYDFVITHRPGKTNPANAPSRRPDYADATKAANQMLPTLFEKLAIEPDISVVSALLTSSENAPRMRATSIDTQRRMTEMLDSGEETASRRARAIETQDQRIVPTETTRKVTIREFAGEAIALRRDVVYALHAESAYSDGVVTTTNLVKKAQGMSSETQALKRRIAEGEMNKN
jgi:hypothetical protein